MLKFTMFLKLAASLLESKDTTSGPGMYGAVKPDAGSIKRIRQLINELGLENSVSDKDLHATVMNSRKHVNEIDAAEAIVVNLPASGFGDELAIFGQRAGDKCLVLKLSSLELRAIFAQLGKLGASYDFPTYEAHITLAYGLPANFELPKHPVLIPIHFNDFEMKPLED